MQPQPAVAAEHRDAFGEIVERFALNADQLLETPFEIEPLGDVVEQIGDAAVRIGRGDDAQGASAGQMPGMFLGFDGAIGLVQLRLPLPEILFLRQLARRAQHLDHRRIGRGLDRGSRRRDPTARDRRHCRKSAGDRRRTWRRRSKVDRACGGAHRQGARARRACVSTSVASMPMPALPVSVRKSSTSKVRRAPATTARSRPA